MRIDENLRIMFKIWLKSLIKEKQYIFRGGNSSKIVFLLPEKGSTLKGKNLLPRVYSKRKEFAPLGSKFFPFRVDPFEKGVGV